MDNHIWIPVADERILYAFALAHTMCDKGIIGRFQIDKQASLILTWDDATIYSFVIILDVNEHPSRIPTVWQCKKCRQISSRLTRSNPALPPSTWLYPIPCNEYLMINALK